MKAQQTGFREFRRMNAGVKAYTYDLGTTLAGTGAGGCLTAKKGA